jgi:predicted nucleic acid-binding protein
MTGFLLDTNVPSELTRPQSDPNVEAWLNAADDEKLYLSAVSLGEIFKGLTVLPASARCRSARRQGRERPVPW